MVAALTLLLTLVIGAGGFSPGWAPTSFTNDLRDVAPGGPPPPAVVIWVLMVVANVFTAYTVNGLVAPGEETGWYSRLQSTLEPLGRKRGIVLTGVIWGPWHAPLIVIDYEYDGKLPAAADATLFTCLCAGLGTLLSQLRVRSNNVLPATITHGAFNAFASLPATLMTPGDDLDPVLVGLIGWPAVVLFGFLAVLLPNGSWAGRTDAVQGAPS